MTGSEAKQAAEDDRISRLVTIANTKGLHARASAKFVKCAESFDADISVTRGPETVAATSIMGLMLLAAGIGSKIELAATGPEAAEAIAALAELVESRFEEE
ncbi:MAG: HPr family phosphocarrier protein [Hyphomicrobiales bacterium]|nr:MAG: HPr family phosphocarrier protein [Hyphomicrobiales bacterium]